MRTMSRRLRRGLLIPPLVLGAVILGVLVVSRSPPERHPPEERSVPVRVVAVPEVAVVPRAFGHGVVEPARVWDGVAEIAARVVEEHPDLARGAVLSAGAVLLRLDAADVELRVAQAEAAIAVLEARIREIERREANTGTSLLIEARALALAERELERQRRLLAQGTVAQAVVDREERQVVAQRQAVQSLENLLALLPVERDVLSAQIRQAEADLDAARLDLARTELRLPFDARIAQVNVRADQFVSPGQVLVVADGIERAEVNAQLTMDRLRRFLPDELEPVAIAPDTVARRVEALGLEAVVRLDAGDLLVEWPGRVARLSETVDPRTRTLGVIIEVDDPYREVVPGRRPPLVKAMFVEVEIRGRATEPLPVIPRAALRGGRVHVVGADQRLEIRPVEAAFLQGEVVVIASGLTAGEQVVVSDLVSAVEGMRLRPLHDDGVLEKLLREAGGTDAGS
jgi:membrane fusion protein, multidrug efflux system